MTVAAAGLAGGVADMESKMMASRARIKPVRYELPEKSPSEGKSQSEGVIMVDTDLKPLAMDSGGEAILHDLNYGCGDPEVFPGLPRQMAGLLNGEPGMERDGMQLTVSGRGCEYSCRTFLVKSRGEEAPVLILHFRRELSLFDAVRQVAAEYHLTDREQEALMGISRGLSSKEVAVQMKISPNTVKAFLRLIMIKMGTGSRAGLVAKLLDQNGLRVSPPSSPRVTVVRHSG